METPHDALAAVRNTNFRRFLTYRFLFTFAVQMEATVVAWIIYQLTGDPLSLGLIGLAEAVPYLCTSLIGGYAADRMERKKIATAATAVFTAGSLLFYAAALMPDVLPATQPWFYYLVIFTTGVARGFLQPSITALFAQVLPRNLYANGAAWNTNTWQSAAVAGPAAGGMVLGFFSNATAFGIVLAVSVASWLVIASMPRYAVPDSGAKGSVMQSIGDGVKFVFNNQVLFGALTLDLVAVLFAGAMAVLPVFASDVLNVGPEGLGYLRGAPFLGSVLMGFYMATRRPMRNAGRNMMLAVCAYGVCLILFAASTHFWLSMFLLMLSGMCDNISVVTRSTILQLSTPEHMRGRVSSVNNIFVGTSNELGAFVAGVNARLFGIVLSVTLGGSISIVAAAVTAWKAPRLRNLNLRELQEQHALGK